MSNTLPSISETSLSAANNATTSSVTASAMNTGGSTISYSWQKSGTACTITSTTAATTTFTGASTTGSTTVYCNITNSQTGATLSTPICTINWITPSIAITAMSFTLNTVSFTTRQYRSAGPTYTINVSSVTPAGATYSPSSTAQTTAGNYTLTSSGTGTYTGSFTSAILSLVSASITQNSPRTATVVPLSVVLSQTPPGVTYAWLRTAGTACSFSASTAANTNCTGSGTLTSTVQCTVAYTGSTTSPSTNLVPTTVIQWGII